MRANAHIMIVSFGFWDEMIKNMVLICSNLFEQIIIRLFTHSNEGFTWLRAVSKTFALVDECLDSVYGVRCGFHGWMSKWNHPYDSAVLDLWENQKGEVSNVFLTYFDYFFGGGGVNTNLLRGTREGVKRPDKSSTATQMFGVLSKYILFE